MSTAGTGRGASGTPEGLSWPGETGGADGLSGPGGTGGPGGCGLGPGETAVVIGISQTGQSVSRHLLGRGIAVRLIEEHLEEAVEDAAAREAAASELRSVGAEVIFGEGAGHLDGAAVVVPSPGVPEGAAVLRAAAERGLPVISEVELGFRMLEERRSLGGSIALAAITGTNGKTTVTTLLEACGKAAGLAAVACGNIGYPFIDAVVAADEGALLVAEVSSFQLRFCERFRPDVAVLLNFASDHLNWHPTMEAYAAAKGRIFANLGGDETAVWNLDDRGAAAIASASVPRGCRRWPFSKASAEPGRAGVSEGILVGPGGEEIIAVRDLYAGGDVALENALAASSAARALQIPPAAIREALASFGGLAHRMQVVAAYGGVDFVDDSKATNPHAAAMALRSYPSVVLIAGGQNKGIDLNEMIAGGLPDGLRAVVAIGEAAGEIAGVFAGAFAGAFGGRRVEVRQAAAMADAVEAAWGLAAAGDTILLSPACASFDQYENYAARGDDFQVAVRALIARNPTVPGVFGSKSKQATPGLEGERRPSGGTR